MEKLLAATASQAVPVHLSMAVGMGCKSRVMMLNYQQEHKYFFFATKNVTKKYQELKANPHVCITLYDPKSMDQVVAQALVSILEDAETKKQIWYEGMRQYGYEGPEDPKMVVLKLTLGSIAEHKMKAAPLCTPGQISPTSYANLPPPPPKDPLPALNAADGQAAMLEAFKKDPMVLLTTRNNLDVTARYMMLRHKDQIGFHFLTFANSPKAAQILANPLISWCWWNPANELFKQIVVDAVAIPTTSPDQRQAIWDDSLTQYGYKGPEDPNLVVIRTVPVQVDTITMGTVSHRLVEGAPLQAAFDEIQRRFDANPNVLLCTHAPEGRIAARMMMMRCNPQLGPYFLTFAPSAKVQQIKANDAISFFWNFEAPTPCQVSVRAKAFVVQDAAMRHAVWQESLRSIGFKGPDDENLTVIRYVPLEVVVNEMSKPEQVVYKREYSL